MTNDIMLSQAIKVFLIARQADSYSFETIHQYKWALDRLLKQGDKPVKDVSTEDIRLFLSYLQTAYIPVRPDGAVIPLASASIFAAWKAIRGFYKWASPELGIPNPSTRIPAPRHASAITIPFTQEEVKLLLKACERTKLSNNTDRKGYSQKRPTGLRDRAIVLTLLDTGLRVSELCRLQMQDMNLQVGELVVRPFGASIKSRPRIIPLGKAALKALALYTVGRANTKEYVFLNQKESDAPMDRMNILQILRRLGEKAGIHGVHPHKFRNTFAIMFLRNGGDIFSLQRILGHATLDMVRHYLELAQSDVGNAHKKASPADNWRL